MPRVTYHGPSRPITRTGALGYDPDLPTGEVPDPVDYADEAGWFLPAAVEPDIALVQSQVAIDTGPSVAGTFDSAPAAGNLLVAILTSRSGTSTAALTGWTAYPSTSGITISGFANGRLYILYKIAASGESSTVSFTGLDGSGKRLFLAEYSGALEFDLAANASGSGTSSLTTGPLTPTAGLPALILGIISQATGSTMTIGGGFTEADEGETSQEAPGGAFGPTTMVGYRIEDPTAGSYTMTASSSQSDDHKGAILSFTTDPDAVVWLPALAVNDGSDTTFDAVYESGIISAGDVFLRGSIGLAYVLASIILRAGFEDAGSTTVTVEGATDEDFTSPVTLGSATFTATGSYTAQDVTITVSGDGYPYIRFLIGASQGVRVYEVELFGPPDPSDAIDDHLTDTTDAHDASTISIVDAGGFLTASDVEAAIQEMYGDFLTVNEGGGDLLSTVAASGTTETIDLTDGNVHDVTLTANCTFTFNPVSAGRGRSFTLVLRQDGTGSRLATWPGSVVWAGGVAPTLSTAAASVDVFTFFTLDGGTVWYGFSTGGGSAVGALDDLSDVTITSPVTGALLQYNGSAWVDVPATDAGHYEILMASGSADPLLTSDGLDYLYVWVT